MSKSVLYLHYPAEGRTLAKKRKRRLNGSGNRKDLMALKTKGVAGKYGT